MSRVRMSRVGVAVYMAIAFVVPIGFTNETANARKPYFRVYGNDVVAGGGYGEPCINDPAFDHDVEGYGKYITPPGLGPESTRHNNYIGAGAELGVFTPGTIFDFLPGAVSTTQPQAPRSALWELSFANNDGTKTNGTPGDDKAFGGGYDVPLCEEYFPDPSTEPGWVTWTSGVLTLPGGELVCDYMDIAALPDGAKIHIQSGGFHFGSGCDTNPPADLSIHRNHTSVIPADGREITIYIEGDLTILPDIAYANAASGWASPADIPLLKVYADANLKIDYDVNVITGLYYASGGGAASPGHFWSCTDSSRILSSQTTIPTAPPGLGIVDDIAALCNNPLTVYGALVTDEAFLYRTNGDIETAEAGGASYIGEEPNGTGNIAEQFIFSPEIYMSLLDQATTPTIDTDSVDAVRSLPPAF